jgi:tetratricopeptide (TPR) repeat protein
LCYVFALLSKEQGMLTPLLMLMAAAAVRLGNHDVPDPEPDPARRERARRTALLLAFFVCATAAAYIVYRESILRFWWDRSKLDWTMNPLVRSTGADRWLVPVALVGRCAALLVAPAKLSFDYGTAISPAAHWGDPYLWLGFAAVALWLVLLGFAVARRDGPAAFCLVAFAVLYGVVSNFLSLIGTVFAERTLYLPSAFFVVLVGLYVSRLRSTGARRAAAGVLVVLLALGSLRTVTYAARWNDPLDFYEAALRDRPDSHQIQLVLANERRVRGDLDGAARLLERTRAAWPESDQAWIYSASVELDRGNLDAAEAYAQRAFALQNSMQAFGILTEVAERRAATRPATAPSVK